jgi:thymidylate kinase
MEPDRDQFAAVRPQSEVGATASSWPASHTRGPMVVEFIGIPGSGKTALCTAIVSELRRDGFTVITEHDYFRWMHRPLYKKLCSVVGSGMRTWRFTLYIYYFLYRCTLLRGRALWGMGFHLTCMRVWLSGIVSRAQPVLVLLDGFAWFRLTNRLRDYPAKDIAGTQLTRSVGLFYPRCDMHWIFKTIPVDVAVQRISRRMMRDREPKGIERSSPDRRRVVLTRQTQLYQAVCHSIQSQHRDNVYWVDGAEPIPEQVDRVKRILTDSFQQETCARPIYDASPSTRPRKADAYASSELAGR